MGIGLGYRIASPKYEFCALPDIVSVPVSLYLVHLTSDRVWALDSRSPFAYAHSQYAYIFYFYINVLSYSTG